MSSDCATPQVAQPPSDFELRKLKLEEEKIAIDRDKINLEREKLKQDLANHRSTITNGYRFNAARSSLLLNGGSAIAFLAFLGAVVRTPTNRIDIEAATFALKLLSMGSLLAASSLMFGYLTRISYNESDPSKPRKRWFTIWLEVGSVAPGVISIVIYAIATLYIPQSFRAAAISALRTDPPPQSAPTNLPSVQPGAGLSDQRLLSEQKP